MHHPQVITPEFTFAASKSSSCGPLSERSPGYLAYLLLVSKIWVTSWNFMKQLNWTVEFDLPWFLLPAPKAWTQVKCLMRLVTSFLGRPSMIFNMKCSLSSCVSLSAVTTKRSWFHFTIIVLGFLTFLSISLFALCLLTCLLHLF